MAIKPTDYMKHALLPAKKQRKEITKRIESQLEAAIDAQLLENASRHPMSGRQNVHFFIDDKFFGLDAKFSTYSQPGTKGTPQPLTCEERYSVFDSIIKKYQAAGWYISGLNENWDGRLMHMEMSLGNPYGA